MIRFIALACLLATSFTVNAATVFYTDKATFLAAAGVASAIMTYEDVPLNAQHLAVPTSPYTENGIIQSDLDLVIGAGFGGGVYDIGTGKSGQTSPGSAGSGSAITTFTSLGKIYAGGATVFTVNDDATHKASSVMLTTSSGESESVATPSAAGSSAFIGFIADTDMTSFSLTSADYLETDNIMVYDSEITTVPLPAAAWLFISAIGGLVVAKRKQLKA